MLDRVLCSSPIVSRLCLILSNLGSKETEHNSYHPIPPWTISYIASQKTMLALSASPHLAQSWETRYAITYGFWSRAVATGRMAGPLSTHELANWRLWRSESIWTLVRQLRCNMLCILTRSHSICTKGGCK